MPSFDPVTQTPQGLGSNDGVRVRTIEPAIICFSHLRWDFVVQRPQHLMRRFADARRVFFFEEYIPCDHPLPYLEYHPFPADNVIAIRPRLPNWWDAPAREAALAELLAMLVDTSLSGPPVLWFYTPMMYAFAADVPAAAVVYDCMDELSGFRFADPRLQAMELSLMERANVVFTGGYSLYEAKREFHSNIHPFPSAVDVDHFRTARSGNLAAPADQAGIPRPVLGYFGVVDERIDLDLLRMLAKARPKWSFVMVGPLSKIDPSDLPRLPNIHWLGRRRYDELPGYLAGWNVALMPFAINEATRFISPTKTPEYLAGGRPVVSTPVVDVVRHHGSIEAVTVADAGERFLAACEAALALPPSGDWLVEADALLADISWDRTFAEMARLVGEAVLRARSARVDVANDESAGAMVAGAPVTASPTP